MVADDSEAGGELGLSRPLLSPPRLCFHRCLLFPAHQGRTMCQVSTAFLLFIFLDIFI